MAPEGLLAEDPGVVIGPLRSLLIDGLLSKMDIRSEIPEAEGLRGLWLTGSTGVLDPLPPSDDGPPLTERGVMEAPSTALTLWANIRVDIVSEALLSTEATWTIRAVDEFGPAKDNRQQS